MVLNFEKDCLMITAALCLRRWYRGHSMCVDVVGWLANVIVDSWTGLWIGESEWRRSLTSLCGSGLGPAGDEALRISFNELLAGAPIVARRWTRRCCFSEIGSSRFGSVFRAALLELATDSAPSSATASGTHSSLFPPPPLALRANLVSFLTVIFILSSCVCSEHLNFFCKGIRDGGNVRNAGGNLAAHEPVLRRGRNRPGVNRRGLNYDRIIAW